MFNTFCGNDTNFSIKDGARVHMIGIGGVGMCALAQMAQAAGFHVSGSDREEGELLPLLRRCGLPISVGKETALPLDAEVVVYTLALEEAHGEIKAALERGLPLLSRADFLGLLMRRYTFRVGVAGIHGKSTVTAMIGKILRDARMHPTVLCGARMEDGDVYISGKKEILVYEACEYRDSFLATAPTHPVLLNIGFDHPDWFADLGEVESAFARFARKPTVQEVIFNEGDAHLRKIASDVRVPLWRFGGEGGGVTAVGVAEKNGYYSFTLKSEGTSLGYVSLRVPGQFQVENALAAASAALAVGAPPEGIAASLNGYRGVHRRMEYLGKRLNCDLWTDYAHHPVAIAKALSTAKAIAKGRVVYLFQPHTYSRTEALFAEFSEALRGEATGAILKTFAAREKDGEKDPAEMLASACGAFYAKTESAAADWLRKTAQKGDLILLLGAGELQKVLALLED